MRWCPLLRDDIRCSPAHPWCPMCDTRAAPIVPTAQISTPVVGRRGRKCVACGVDYSPGGPRQERCKTCAVEHYRKKNLQYVHTFRQRHPRDVIRQSIPEYEHSEWEQLHANGESASEIAIRFSRSHHTVLAYLNKPAVRWRVACLRIEPPPELPPDLP